MLLTSFSSLKSCDYEFKEALGATLFTIALSPNEVPADSIFSTPDAWKIPPNTYHICLCCIGIPMESHGSWISMDRIDRNLSDDFGWSCGLFKPSLHRNFQRRNSASIAIPLYIFSGCAGHHVIYVLRVLYTTTFKTVCLYVCCAQTPKLIQHIGHIELQAPLAFTHSTKGFSRRMAGTLLDGGRWFCIQSIVSDRLWVSVLMNGSSNTVEGLKSSIPVLGSHDHALILRWSSKSCKFIQITG